MKTVVLLATLLVLLLAGCSAVPDSTPLTGPKAGPVIRNFEISPAMIEPGQTAIMTWSVTGADSVMIDPFVGKVPSSGSMEISPYYNSSYSLTAYGSSGVASTEHTIKVNADPTCALINESIRWSPSERALYPVTNEPPVIASFTIEPSEVSPGEAVTMKWDVKGAALVYISPDVGSVPGTGSTSIIPLASTVYVLIARNSFDTVETSAGVSVAAPSK